VVASEESRTEFLRSGEAAEQRLQQHLVAPCSYTRGYSTALSTTPYLPPQGRAHKYGAKRTVVYEFQTVIRSAITALLYPYLV
jgi:hypothetical protein